LDSYRIAALGANCGRDIGMPQMLDVVEQYRDNTFRRVFVRPNAGTPKQVEDGWVYPYSPEYMASWLPELLEAGVCMVGGCCGTTPAHIAAFRKVIDEWNARQT
jgi:5-methyltetrahydrofolate--homocysteine methyltransferase